MTDISHVLPDFPIATFAHLIAPLERAGITTAELVCGQAADVARKAQIPPTGAAKLMEAVVEALHAQVKEQPLPEWQTISFLDPVLDAAWNGGAPTRYLSEITGESGVGKTQFLLTLLLSVQLPAPQGLDKSALYISTEAALSTTRLAQILESHPRLCDVADSQKPSLSRIHAIQVPDLEAQDHILRYQVPVAIRRFDVGLLVIDSIASNYRAELDVLPPTSAVNTSSRAPTHILAERRAHLVRLGALLRDLAHTHNIAIVVSNQVADRFDPPTQPQPQPAHADLTTGPAASSAPPPAHYNNNNFSPTSHAALVSPRTDPLTLDHQQRWITGWGDQRAPTSHQYLSATAAAAAAAAAAAGSGPADKTPALGLAWTTQLAARVALIKEPVVSLHAHSRQPLLHVAEDDVDGTGKAEGEGERERERERETRATRRWMRVVFGAWMPQSCGPGVAYEVVRAGVRALPT